MQTINTNKHEPSPQAVAFGKRLRMVMRKEKIDQVDLVTQTGINKSTVSQWFNGLVKAGPKNNRILADFLECDEEWLATGIEEPYPTTQDAVATGAYDELKYKTKPDSGRMSTAREIPVYGKVVAGFPEEMNEEIIEFISLPNTPKNCYAFKINGRSMEPNIKHDDYVLFVIDQEIQAGDVVIINNEWGETMVKRYQIKGDEQFLISDNPEFPTFKANDHYRIVGKVIDVWRKVNF